MCGRGTFARGYAGLLRPAYALRCAAISPDGSIRRANRVALWCTQNRKSRTNGYVAGMLNEQGLIEGPLAWGEPQENFAHSVGLV